MIFLTVTKVCGLADSRGISLIRNSICNAPRADFLCIQTKLPIHLDCFEGHFTPKKSRTPVAKILLLSRKIHPKCAKILLYKSRTYPFWMNEMPLILLYFCLGCKHWNSIVVKSSWFPLFFQTKCYHAYNWEHGKFLFSIIWCYSSSVVIGRHKIQRTISWRPGVCGMVQWSNGPKGPMVQWSRGSGR